MIFLSSCFSDKLGHLIHDYNSGLQALYVLYYRVVKVKFHPLATNGFFVLNNILGWLGVIA